MNCHQITKLGLSWLQCGCTCPCGRKLRLITVWINHSTTTFNCGTWDNTTHLMTSRREAAPSVLIPEYRSSLNCLLYGLGSWPSDTEQQKMELACYSFLFATFLKKAFRPILECINHRHGLGAILRGLPYWLWRAVPLITYTCLYRRQMLEWICKLGRQMP